MFRTYIARKQNKFLWTHNNNIIIINLVKGGERK